MSSTQTQIPAERTAHSFSGSQYILPSDEEERERLVRQHQLYTKLFSGRLIFPPVVLSANLEILDIGTGAGAWLTDCRAQLPESIQIYGIDIEPRLFPAYSFTSPNVHLSVTSATALPSYWSSKFILVHQRLLIAAYTKDEWYKVAKEMYRVLQPGGYAQLIEIGPDFISGPKTATHVSVMERLFDGKGLVFRCCDHIQDVLASAGFIDVRVETAVMRLGKWAGNDGISGRNETIGAWKGMKDAIMRAGGMGKFNSGEEVENAMEEIAEEWDTTEGSYTTLKVFYGQKPVNL
ncbi:S-adenosyl-L-methionine-dependent methyltransferase [Phlebopus sp. FC_14]|nr:S-adenosyl-L-methionine-dependent methyltransferase [Phlebopus sp. FC_14]